MIKVKTKGELRELINKRMQQYGNNCDLNDIDVSEITNMSFLFAQSEFNGDISKWNVSNVENMLHMFSRSKFNGDISNWDVSKVYDMSCMFNMSNFNGDIGKWKFRGKCYKQDFLTASKYVAKSYDNFEVNLDDFQSLVKSIEELKSTPNIENILAYKKDLNYLEHCYLQSNGDVENIIRSHIITGMA